MEKRERREREKRRREKKKEKTFKESGINYRPMVEWNGQCKKGCKSAYTQKKNNIKRNGEEEGERKEKLRKVELNTMVEWNGLCDTGPDVKQHTHEMESDLTMKASLSNSVCSSPFS